MTTLLHIIASARGGLSHSRQAAEATVRRLIEQDPTLTVIERDLGCTPVAHPDFQFIQASLMREAERGEPQRAALALSDALINELDAADFVMLSMPMHNFMVPSVLKAWLDYVVRLGRTFQITAAGKVGLLRDRPIRVLMACGGALGDGLTGQPDFVTPYLRYVSRLSALRICRCCRSRIFFEAQRRRLPRRCTSTLGVTGSVRSGSRREIAERTTFDRAGPERFYAFSGRRLHEVVGMSLAAGGDVGASTVRFRQT
ncbi:FMN-dependent NADH-azoreductase [Undibacterium arcticum]|uniref:FMN-dependent NADH-azoreductase n=1 Tax=Undibacterium arcticum TaxID=1762892 RepID=UPI003612DA15